MTNSCPTYAWCELDHTDPELAQYGDIHEKHPTITVGELEQDFTLEINAGGQPRLEAALDHLEVWLEPAQSVNSLRDLSELYRRMADEYDGFVRDVTPTLRHSLP